MNHPLLALFEGEGRLTALLRPLAEANGWALREPRQVGACLRLLARGEPAALVLRVGRDLERELALLERVTRQRPHVRAVVVLEGDHARLAGLAWDLGAAFVVAPPFSRDDLPELVTALLRPEGQAP